VSRTISRVDLHVHSSSSGDNDADLEEIVERAVLLGLDGIVMTEHYSYAASEPVERLREKYRGSIVLLRGVEFSADEGHCLVFGVDTDRLDIRHAPVREVAKAVAGARGVMIPSHPYRGVNSLGDLVLGLSGIVGIEGFNGANMHAMNVRAVETAARLGLPYSGGSDAHSPSDVGSCYTEFEGPVTEETFLGLLKTGKFRGVDTRKISRRLFP
jgi:predicted metal-dependent phosphoesterase TrpH